MFRLQLKKRKSAIDFSIVSISISVNSFKKRSGRKRFFIIERENTALISDFLRSIREAISFENGISLRSPYAV